MSTKFLAMVQEVGVRGCLRARKHPSKETEVHAESLVGVRCSRNSAEALVAFAAVSSRNSAEAHICISLQYET